MTMNDYDTACARATAHQGLVPIVDALTAAGHTAYVEQTGGFTMVGYVDLPDRNRVGFTAECVTVERFDGSLGYTVASDEPDDYPSLPTSGTVVTDDEQFDVTDEGVAFVVAFVAAAVAAASAGAS